MSGSIKASAVGPVVALLNKYIIGVWLLFQHFDY